MSRQKDTPFPDVAIIIPVLNEEFAIPLVLRDIPKTLVSEIIVVDNNSTDRSAEQAALCGAIVVHEKKRGYGSACRKGLEYLQSRQQKPDIVVFLDGDYSDYPEEMSLLIEPMVKDGYDLVIGSRTKVKAEKGSMTITQKLGNRLITFMIKLLFGYSFSDLGPFRAIRYEKLIQLGIEDRSYGWTIEMQLKALYHKLKIQEVPVSYRVRIGTSKISGSIVSSLKAGFKIMITIIRCRLKP